MMQSGQLEIFLALLPPNWQTCPVAKPGVKTSVGAPKTITRSCLEHECWRGWILFFPEKSQRIEWKCRWGKIGESRTKEYGENLVIRETRVIFHSSNNQKNSKAKLLQIPCLYKKQNQLSKGKAKMTEKTARALTGYGAQCQYQLFSTLLRKLPLSLQKVFQIKEVSQMATVKSESCSPLEEIKSVSSVWQGDGKKEYFLWFRYKKCDEN